MQDFNFPSKASPFDYLWVLYLSIYLQELATLSIRNK